MHRLLLADETTETGQILTISPADIRKYYLIKKSGVVVVWFVSLYIYLHRNSFYFLFMQNIVTIIKWVVRIGTAILAAIAAVGANS